MDLQILKAEQERQGKLIDGLVKATDIQSLKADLEKLKKDGVEKQSDIQLFKEQLKTELEQLKKDGDDKKSRIHFFTEELERLDKLIGELNKQLNNQTLRSEQERQGKLIDALLKKTYQSCTDAKSSGINEIIIPNLISHPFKVACDSETRGGGWTIILRRMDGTVDFYRNWTEYKEGFGDLNGEFFLGLDKIHALTEERNHELLVVLEDLKGIEAFEMYDKFAIGDEDQQYVLHTLGYARGTAGDSLGWHRGMKFTTYDRDNDNKKDKNCAVVYSAAWWYNACHASNLAGKYNDNRWDKGVIWNTFKGHDYSLKKAVMMIRPKE
ncbi:ficolin-1-like [Drosophila innubila]|uniref:ficolin-1-like n=1 Tax=Drosophila innubila TaxID=198719 RepID=UPI00148DB792|nr:ficolin-1-like [Drosophila innubila]